VVDRERDLVLVVRVHDERRIPEDLAERRRLADHERHAARRRLERGQAEPLVLRERDEDVGRGVAARRAPGRPTKPERPDVRAEPPRRHERLEIEPRVRAVVPDEVEHDARMALAQARDRRGAAPARNGD
jgi:hypothetical protein